MSIPDYKIIESLYHQNGERAKSLAAGDEEYKLRSQFEQELNKLWQMCKALDVFTDLSVDRTQPNWMCTCEFKEDFFKAPEQHAHTCAVYWSSMH